MQKRLALLLFITWFLSLAARGESSILLVTIDTLRADHVSPEQTPGLWQLAGESVFFEQAITVSPLTLPSHASLLTGLLPMNHGVRDNSIFVLPSKLATFTALFKNRGYRTAAFVSSIVLDHRFGLNSSFDVYDDHFDPPERDSPETLARALDWVGRSSAPFFLWVHLFDPHTPYRGSYGEEVRRVDGNLEEFFDQLKDLGRWEDLIVAVTSDHGEALGEHGERTHGFFIYDSTIRIPLILKVPGLKAGRFPFQVSLVDLLPSISEFLEVPAEELLAANLQADGRGLRSDLELNRDPQRAAYSETFLPNHQFGWSELQSLRLSGQKLIQAPRPEFYNLRQDPNENDNLWTREENTAKDLSARLSRLNSSAQSQKDARTTNLIPERFMSLGYIGSAPPAAAPGSSAVPDPKDRLETYLLVMDALELSETGHPEQALVKLAQAEMNDPEVTQIHFVKGSILGGIGRFSEAIQSLQRTLELNPLYVTGRFKLAQAFLATGQLEQAKQALQVSLEQDPNNFRAYHNLAVIAVRGGDLFEAERLERKALSINDSYYEAWNTLGAIQISSQQADLARESLSKALSIQPNSGQAYYNLSLAESALGNESAARKAATRACELDPRFCRG